MKAVLVACGVAAISFGLKTDERQQANVPLDRGERSAVVAAVRPKDQPVRDASEETSKGRLAIRLTCLEPAPEVGRPLPVRAELVNNTNVSHEYVWNEGWARYAFRITGPDGGECPFVGLAVQTLEPPPAMIEPGRTVVLAATYDLTRDYLFTEPGLYRVGFSTAELSAFAEAEEIIVDVKPGKVRPSDQLTAAVLEVMPDGWRFLSRWGELTKLPSGEPSPEGVGLSLARRETTKSWDLTIYQTPQPPREPAQVADATSTVCLGKNRWGAVYLSSRDPDVDRHWPDYRQAIAEAVGIGEQTPGELSVDPRWRRVESRARAQGAPPKVFISTAVPATPSAPWNSIRDVIVPSNRWVPNPWTAKRFAEPSFNKTAQEDLAANGPEARADRGDWWIWLPVADDAVVASGLVQASYQGRRYLLVWHGPHGDQSGLDQLIVHQVYLRDDPALVRIGMVVEKVSGRPQGPNPSGGAVAIIVDGQVVFADSAEFVADRWYEVTPARSTGVSALVDVLLGAIGPGGDGIPRCHPVGANGANDGRERQ